MNIWFRRVRLTTMGDLFEDRFHSKFLASFYAVVVITQAILIIGFGNMLALRTLQPIMVKPSALATLHGLRHTFAEALSAIINILAPDAVVTGGDVGNFDLLIDS